MENGWEITLETLGLMIGKRFAYNDPRFDAMELRLGTIERLLLALQERRLSDPEVRMKKLQDALAA
jgi:hypothetical protein